MKPWVIQSFLTFDPMDRTLMCASTVEQYFIVVLFVLPSVVIVNIYRFLELVLSGVKG